MTTVDYSGLLQGITDNSRPDSCEKNTLDALGGPSSLILVTTRTSTKYGIPGTNNHKIIISHTLLYMRLRTWACNLDQTPLITGSYEYNGIIYLTHI